MAKNHWVLSERPVGNPDGGLLKLGPFSMFRVDGDGKLYADEEHIATYRYYEESWQITVKGSDYNGQWQELSFVSGTG